AAGAAPGFVNMNGNLHVADALSISAAFDLNLVYINLATQPSAIPIAALLGQGQVLTPAVYAISGVSSLDGILTLDALGDPNACFVFQLNNAFSTTDGATIRLINGATACNVFWKIDGATNIGAGAAFAGNIVCNGAIELAANSSLDGRALSIAGAIAAATVKIYTPLGCGVPVLSGPVAPYMGSGLFYGLLTVTGAVTNTGITHIDGDIGTNAGPVSGYDPLLVSGTIRLVPDASTNQASNDLNALYTELNALPCEIELLYPVQFGNSQVLTPHVYCMSAAAHFLDTIFLNAQGNPDAVFVIKISGAFTSGTYTNVVLLNGAKATNVFWVIEGAIDISGFTNFKGNIIANNGAVSIAAGGTLEGRAFSTTGAITTHGLNIINNSGGAILPLEITSFDGRINGTTADLVWTTANEENTNYFVVEESADLVHWSVLATVMKGAYSHTAKNYSVTDSKLNTGLNYYRLKQVDVERSVPYSKMLALKNNSSSTHLAVSVYPNPAAGAFNISIIVDKPSAARVEIFDMAGRSVSVDHIQTKTGLNLITTSLKKSPAGIFLIEVTTDGALLTKFVVKQ
ncbi:MAG: ice-binding family protein, partial [Chitinophagaceae bacterium]